MEWAKVKNIIILVLLLVNGFLLALVGARVGEARRYEQAALTQAARVLENSGIRVDLDAAAPADELSPQTVERDPDRELQMARVLLGGDVQAENRGGGLYLYQNENGVLSVRAGGELSAELADGPGLQAHGGPERHAAGLLKEMGVDAEQVAAAEEDGGTRVRFRQRWGGAPLFSCEVEFVYGDGRLAAVRGTLLAAQAGAAQAGAGLTLPTALLRFLDHVRGSGDVCSEIRSMEPGYRAVQSLSGATRLSAVWRISSNTASYYLDASTGELTRLEG